MKTVKLIFIAIVMFVANTAQAQSVEETEQWLNEYGKDITLSFSKTEPGGLYKGMTKFEGFDGEYLNVGMSSNSSNGGGVQTNRKVLPKDILYQDLSTFSESDFEDDEYTQEKTYQLKAKSGTVFFFR